MRPETIALRAGYKPQNGEPHTMPIYQSTTFEYTSSQHIGQLFDDPTMGYIYSRFANPTASYVEEKIAALEGGAGAMLTSSGQAATMVAVTNICSAGDHFVSAASIYGGTVNLFAVTLKRFGIDCTFVDQDASEEEIQRAIKPNTKLIFGETIANPAISVLDIEKFARIAHQNNLPLFVDNTFAPTLCRPFEWGADIIIHSTTKYMDGHAVLVGGVIVDGGTFDWSNGMFPCFTEPDESYHGIIYHQQYGKLAFLIKARMQMMRDLGAFQSAQNAFLLDLGLQTLPLRMERHCKNAAQVAELLDVHDKVESVRYPTLKGSPYRDLAQKYLPSGCSGVISFTLKGGRDAAVRFIDSLKLASNVVHVADIRTLVLHPASSTHRQLTDEQLEAAGITPGLIRLSVGCEHIDDIIEDVTQALGAV
ncbi:O-acetylhomoserine aminocarboxypropyltransferase/cysteine synthase [Eubacteriales bacterium OttesenSCG-928-N13]|nr:O-acetylhomoserine aminocarboxypropyltransferase/cysteine synthase [Eubacteriales bacterium OttesenSCG-928-N13]